MLASTSGRRPEEPNHPSRRGTPSATALNDAARMLALGGERAVRSRKPRIRARSERRHCPTNSASPPSCGAAAPLQPASLGIGPGTGPAARCAHRRAHRAETARARPRMGPPRATDRTRGHPPRCHTISGDRRCRASASLRCTSARSATDAASRSQSAGRSCRSSRTERPSSAVRRRSKCRSPMSPPLPLRPVRINCPRRTRPTGCKGASAEP